MPQVKISDLTDQAREAYNKRMASDPRVKAFARKIENRTAVYEDAYTFATSSGETIGDILVRDLMAISPTIELDAETLHSVIIGALQIDYDSVTDAAGAVQKIKNESIGLGVKPIMPDFEPSRARNIQETVLMFKEDPENMARFFTIRREVVEHFVNNALHTIDMSVKKNADYMNKIGITPRPRIVRKSTGDCCEWCSNLEGSYLYPDETLGTDVFRRHKFCRCTTTYICGKEVENVWAKNKKK